MSNNPEILSPAGNFECFVAAVENGADAVYVGGKKFSARKNAINFSDEELKMAVSYAHNRDCKVYVTLNTLVTDDEIPSVFEFIKYCYNIGIDALIVQDLSIVSLVREHFSDFPIHASTQMTVYSLDGVKMAEKLGFKRVVLARELSEKEIKYICDNSNIEIEVFVHGAICVSYSGQCLLSSMIGQRSGNRGNCAQPCRLPYTLCDKDGNKISKAEKYILSPKDMCLVNEIERLKKCGVKSFKIEGRMKNKEYVATSTRLYSKARDGLVVTNDDFNLLENIFSRSGFTKAYFNDEKLGKDFLNLYKNNDDVYDNITKDTLEKARETAKENSKKIKIRVKVFAETLKQLKVICTDGKSEISVESENNIQKALSKPTTPDVIQRQLEKLGDTPFEIESMDISADDDIFIPLGEINKVRRDMTDLLSALRTKINRVQSTALYKSLKKSVVTDNNTVYNAEVVNIKQARHLLNYDFKKIFVPYHVVIENLDFFKEYNEKFVCILPVVSRDKYNFEFDKISFMDIAVSNIGQINKYAENAYGQHNLNVYNTLVLEEYEKLGLKSVVLSPELNIHQIRQIQSSIDTEIIVYGRLPVMNTENCVVMAEFGKCQCKNGEYYLLKDRISKVFPVFANRYNCTNTIYNSAPICMSDKLSELSTTNVSAYRFLFTIETESEIDRVIKLFESNMKADFDFTRGHFFRGAI